jgi:uncharacterized membrane protein
MNLPKTEYYPDDPNQMPPARRRRAHRLLAPLDADERTAFLERIAQRTLPTFDFFFFSLISGVVISWGLVLNSPVLLLCGALLAPLLSPITGLSLGTITGSGRFFARSLVGLLIGSSLTFSMGLLAGAILRDRLPTELLQAHASPQVSWLNMLILALSAVLVTIYTAHPDRHPTLPNVALVYALYLPLTAAGMGLTGRVPHLWPDGMVVFALYLAIAALVGAITLAILGFRPLTLFGYTLGGTIVLVAILVLAWASLASTVIGTRIALPTYTPSATTTRTLVPPTATRTPTPLPPTITVTATRTPTPSSTPTITPTLSPTPQFALVNSSGSDTGVKLRADPGYQGKVIRIYLNGTLVQLLPDTQTIDNAIWAHVIVTTDNSEGWMLQSLLIVATPAPNW